MRIKRFKLEKKSELIPRLIFTFSAFVSVIALFLIIFFIFSRGVPAIMHVGFFQFLFGDVWLPSVLTVGVPDGFGISTFILMSLVTTAISFAIGSRIGKWCAIFLAFFCPRALYRPLKTMVELLAGIPSVLYGFFGVVVIVPFIRNTFGGNGNSMLAVIIILSIMILPTIINISEAALNAIPKVYYEGAVALGSTKTEAIFDVVVPAAKSGLNAAYVLGIGRAVGETMAVIMVAGNAPVMPTIMEGHAWGPFSILLRGVRTLTTGIALEMGYASGIHQDMLFGIGVVLFVIIIALNIVLTYINRKVS